MAITFRDEKGAPLTHEELDANFLQLRLVRINYCYREKTERL